MSDFEEVLLDPFPFMRWFMIWYELFVFTMDWMHVSWKELWNIFKIDLFLNQLFASTLRIELKPYGKSWIEAQYHI